ncbi:LytR/AlgR family response regulator transcription factor [Clostridium hydrogeniformans]|uniref:LytR/AlgR family response regulator transcription factor n=1 Tax=Clostridium hydrogeniformans TaxID=349933 RepID=UPI0004880F6E|nr:LytTR family DNA-binding domain-containing protein [Clostridium hydrogeniformans]
MINIIVCEDNPIQREKIVDIIKEIISVHNFNMNMALVTGDPYEVIEYSKKDHKPNVYLLDVNLKSIINGILLADKIREDDNLSFIIFITSHEEMSYLTFKYKVEAMDYIIKDNYSNVKNKVYECLNIINKRVSDEKEDNINDIFTISMGDIVRKISCDDIMYFETVGSGHKIRVHCVKRQIEFLGTLKEIKESLDNRFYRSHKSYIVNINNVSFIDKKSKIIHMSNGEQCFVSRNYIKDIIKGFTDKYEKLI